ncbi:MAG: beta-ketoacyl-ACP synthase II [Planctomycetota bacterium]|jgi:3-oxoacyl-[acyl-carrier-protein] synthase II
MSRRRVVITGVGVISSIGSDPSTFWNGILECRSGAGPITAFDATDYKTRFACEASGFDPSETMDGKLVRTVDRFTQMAIAASQQAVDDSGLEIGEDEDPQRFGVITGTGIGGLLEIENQHSILLERGPSRLSPFFIPKIMMNAASGQVAIRYGFQGPNYATASACASSQHALGLALDSIALGATDVVITGGSEACVCPCGIGGFNAMKALSTRNDSPQSASRPFTASRDGFVLGEGAGMFVFESLERAKARGAKIYAEVLGFGMTDDADHIAAPLPDGALAAAAMRAAVKQSGRAITNVNYVNAHGTSTPLNDKMETRAIRSVFGEHADSMMVSSTKSQVGHCLGASGAVELVAIAMGIEQGIVPATINHDDPDPECDLDYVPNAPREAQIEVAISNSFGFGGHNACLCVGRFA